MPLPLNEIARSLSALDSGRTCAVAGLVQRDLLACAARYPQLFPGRPFDPAFFSTISLANTFCAPWHSADELSAANRVTLWIFALDRLIDNVATERRHVDRLVDNCLSVVSGLPPAEGDPLAELLAEVQTDLSGSPAYASLGEVWQDEVRRMVLSMAREWDWKSAAAAGPESRLPTLDGYLDNAEFGFSVVFVAHWIRTAAAGDVRDVSALRHAAWAVQRVIRLLNDIGTYQRDVRTGDLNALKLADRAAVDRQVAQEIEVSRKLLAPLSAEHPGLTLFLERHIAFNTGFYDVTDYQGELEA